MWRIRPIPCRIRAILAMACIGVAPAQGTYRIDGQTSGPVPVGLEEVALLELSGTPGSPVALFVGLEPSRVPTAFGVLGVDPFVPSSFFVLNGYAWPAAGHALSAATGRLTVTVRPFQGRRALGMRCWSQAVIADPTHPEGHRVTTCIEAVGVSPPPEILRISVNAASPGGSVVIDGKHFEADLQNNSVRLRDLQCQVISGSPQHLVVALPAGAESGPLTVTTRNGSAGGDPNNFLHWVTVVAAPIPEQTAASMVFLGDRTAIIGELGIAPAQTLPPLPPAPLRSSDRYTLSVPAGREIFAEVYSYDPVMGSITASSNTVNVRFDPIVRITRGGQILVEDNDSGPELAAGIGLPGGAGWFVADISGEYQVEVDTLAQLSFGHYILVFGHREPSAAMPLAVQRLMPNYARVTDEVILLGTGISSRFGAQTYGVTVDGRPAQILEVREGQVRFVVPEGVRSGIVQLSRGGTSTQHEFNRMASWLTVVNMDFYHESSVSNATLAPPFSILGELELRSIPDHFTFSAVAGRRYRIEANALDDVRNQVTTGAFLQAFPADTELEVNPEGGIRQPLTSDGAGGPASNAMIGGNITPPFRAPATGNYVISVRTLLGFSRGSYLLNVTEVP